jgi:hypothetical protein
MITLKQYEHLVKVVKRAADARSGKAGEFVALVSVCRKIQVAAYCSLESAGRRI